MWGQRKQQERRRSDQWEKMGKEWTKQKRCNQWREGKCSKKKREGDIRGWESKRHKRRLNAEGRAAKPNTLLWKQPKEANHHCTLQSTCCYFNFGRRHACFVSSWCSWATQPNKKLLMTRYYAETTRRLTACTTHAVRFNSHCRAAEGKDWYPARLLRQIRQRLSHTPHLRHDHWNGG